MACGKTCPFVKQVGVIALIVDFFFFQRRAWSFSGDVRLVGSSIAVFDILLLRMRNKSYLGEYNHT